MFKLEIETEGGAFAPDPREEIARILEEVAEALLARPAQGGRSVLLDVNGNLCGGYVIRSTELPQWIEERRAALCRERAERAKDGGA